jgi:sigma-B regulation protein RsbU (phosphoserine phosphatase)
MRPVTEETRSRPGKQPAHPLRLEPIAGPPIDPITIETDRPVEFGRAFDCDFCLPDSSVSRRHAEAMSKGGGWFVIDLGSRHGTMLNGRRIEARRPVELRHGDLLRLGPYAFSVSMHDARTLDIATTRERISAGTIAESVPIRDLAGLTQQRLEYLMEGAALLHEAESEEDLAETVVRLATAGTGYRRAALLRYEGNVEHVAVLARSVEPGDPDDAFTFSRSLIREASAGHTARLSGPGVPNVAHSIQELGIISAICTPITIDATVVGFLYLDNREREGSAFPDAASYVRTLARLASMALADRRRIEIERRQQRLETDLAVAREAQAVLSPPRSGSVGPLRFVFEINVGRLVTGDLFDIFPIDEDRVAICFGDVSGQGVGAAILMTAILAHLRATLAAHGDPAASVHDLNVYVVDRSAHNMFASLWLGVFDRRDRTLRYVDAGHGHWWLRRTDASGESPPAERWLLVGIDTDAHYCASEVELQPGDRIVLYSDGVIEPRNEAGDMFGAEGLIEALRESTSCEDDLARVLAALNAFTGGVPLTDDTTIASVEYVVPG